MTLNQIRAQRPTPQGRRNANREDLRLGIDELLLRRPEGFEDVDTLGQTTTVTDYALGARGVDAISKNGNVC